MSKCNLAIKYSTIRLCLVAAAVVIVIGTLNFRCSEFMKFCESAFAIMVHLIFLFFFSNRSEEMCHLAFTSYFVCYQANLHTLSVFLSISSVRMEWNGIDSNRFSIMGKYTWVCVCVCASASIHSNNFVFLSVCVFRWMRVWFSFQYFKGERVRVQCFHCLLLMVYVLFVLFPTFGFHFPA